MRGSFSIKSVLPALLPNDTEFNYHNLNPLVQNGGQAMTIFPPNEGDEPRQSSRSTPSPTQLLPPRPPHHGARMEKVGRGGERVNLRLFLKTDTHVYVRLYQISPHRFGRVQSRPGESYLARQKHTQGSTSRMRPSKSYSTSSTRVKTKKTLSKPAEKSYRTNSASTR